MIGMMIGFRMKNARTNIAMMIAPANIRFMSLWSVMGDDSVGSLNKFASLIVRLRLIVRFADSPKSFAFLIVG